MPICKFSVALAKVFARKFMTSWAPVEYTREHFVHKISNSGTTLSGTSRSFTFYITPSKDHPTISHYQKSIATSTPMRKNGGTKSRQMAGRPSRTHRSARVRENTCTAKNHPLRADREILPSPSPCLGQIKSTKQRLSHARLSWKATWVLSGLEQVRTSKL